MARIAGTGGELTVTRGLITRRSCPLRSNRNRRGGARRIEHDIMCHARLVDPDCGCIDGYRPARILPAALLLTSTTAIAQSTALVGATVIDGTGKPGVPNAVVVVTRDRLTCVGSAARCPVPAGATRVDVTGRFVTPGLVDAHVHFSQTGWVDGRPDGTQCAGAVSVCRDRSRAASEPGALVSILSLQRSHRGLRCRRSPVDDGAAGAGRTRLDGAARARRRALAHARAAHRPPRRRRDLHLPADGDVGRCRALASPAQGDGRLGGEGVVPAPSAALQERSRCTTVGGRCGGASGGAGPDRSCDGAARGEGRPQGGRRHARAQRRG